MKAYALCLLMLGATAGYVVLHPPANLAIGRGVLAACPTTLGDWNGAELSFEDAVLEELEADEVLVRRYAHGDDVAWLCIVVHQNRRYGAHDPRVCYESQGYGVGPMARHRIDDGTARGLTVNRFDAERGKESRLVYYWWATPGLATADAGAFRDRLALSGALDNRSIGAFVRVEAQVRGGAEATERRLEGFAGQVARTLPGLLAPGTGRTP